jgi:cyclase
MLAKRIIPCLDIKDGRTVKGVNFLDLKDAGDPVELGIRYSEQGADELVFLDITATHEKRKTLAAVAKNIARYLNIPFTIGGGISSVEDASYLLEAGADKISVNSAAVNHPALIDQLANTFGSQFVVVAVDAKVAYGEWYVYLNGGRLATKTPLLQWAKEAENRGAGEILFTSMDHDGTKNGFACATIAELSDILGIPIIASGGAGNVSHFIDVFTIGKADAGLAASIFHFNELNIPTLKHSLKDKGISIRF